MTTLRQRKDIWTLLSLVVLFVFAIFLIYPLGNLLLSAFRDNTGAFTMENFQRFFGTQHYVEAILNSFKISILVTIVTLLIGIPYAYFYTFYRIKGSKLLLIFSIICCMSAPLVGSFSWIYLLGRNGVITNFLGGLGIEVGDIYGVPGIVLVQVSKFYPLALIYMNGAFKNIDNSLMEASENLGCTGIKRFFKVLMQLSMPTVLAAALLIFMRAFADFGTPNTIGLGYSTFPVLIYNQFSGEMGPNQGFACAMGVIAVIVTAAVFLFQKWATNKYKFSLNALHSIEAKKAKGLTGVLMHAYCYIVTAIAILPQFYIIYLSFRNSNYITFEPGYSLINYQRAAKKMLGRSITNTAIIGVAALAIIILLAIIISYLVVRRRNVVNEAIDVVSMLPYIMPGSVIGIAMLYSFNTKPLILTGTLYIMIIACVIRRLPYTTRSATATLMQIPMSIEEASISLGASKMKTFFRITVPMMANGIISGAILSWVAIVTELSSAIMLYNGKTITLTVSTFVAGTSSPGILCAFASVTTAFTVISLIVYILVSGLEDVKL